VNPASAAPRARCIALDHDQVGGPRNARQERGGDRADMPMRVLLSRTAEPLRRQFAKAEVARIEVAMLARPDQARRNPPLGERMSNRCDFDGFRPGADHQPDFDAIQPSP
jgi:hypothetical protein